MYQKGLFTQILLHSPCSLYKEKLSVCAIRVLTNLQSRQNQVGRESISAVVASTLTADRVFHPVASGFLSAVRVFHPVASGTLSGVVVFHLIATGTMSGVTIFAENSEILYQP